LVSLGEAERVCEQNSMDGFQGKTAGRPALDYPHGDFVPDVGDTFAVAPGVYWVRMPLPFSLKWINLWLIDDGEAGWTIVDTGMPTDTTKAAWRTIFDKLLGGRPVWRIIVTHMHPDHIGNAGWLSRKFPGAEFWITRLEYLSCRMLVADTGRDPPKAGLDFYHRAGWSSDQIETYRTRFGGFGLAVSRLPDSYFRLDDALVFEMAGHEWQVIVGNGHSPEHACLFCHKLNLFISGDQLLPKISSNVSVFPTEPKGNPLADWLSSCEKLKHVLPHDVLVLPAHNEPFVGAHDRLDHLIRGHHIALRRLSQRLGQAPRRAIDVFPAIFGRAIDEDSLSMATGEALAHLNYLIEAGSATRQEASDGVIWYQAV
jgi:glyoxylase-like metal-dependent hydrolase (beta-lactamase superfamily II)